MITPLVLTSTLDHLSTLRRRRFTALHTILLLLASLVGPGSARAQGTNLPLLATFTNPSPTPLGNFFGLSTAAGKDLVLFGAQNENAPGFANTGAAYLFGINGTLLTTFTNPAPAYGKYFGASVALVGGDRVLIGAPSDSYSASLVGTAYLYSTNGTLLTSITNPTATVNLPSGFGETVAALGDDRLLIGAPSDYAVGQYGGAAHLFSTNGTLLTTFLSPDRESGALLGISVAVVGNNRVLLGASSASGGGKAYLFNTNGTWLTTFLNPSPGPSEDFGRSLVAVGTNLVLISASGQTVGAGGGFKGAVGAAYLFRTDGALLTTITNPVPVESTYFGSAVAAVGSDRVLIGTYAARAYLFTTNGTLLTTITNYGASTALAGAGSDRVLVGAGYSVNPGTVSLFALPYPQLGLTRNGAAVSLKWVSAETGLVLQQAGSLGATTVWSNSTDTVSVNGLTNIVQHPLGSTNRFFRLRRP
jgi:hypothetical protein